MMRNSGVTTGVPQVHTQLSLPNEEMEAEGMGRQPSPSTTTSQALAHTGHSTPTAPSDNRGGTARRDVRGGGAHKEVGAEAGELRPLCFSLPLGGHCTCHPRRRVFSPFLWVSQHLSKAVHPITLRA